MFGKNKILPPKKNDNGQSLDIVNIFKTIQGEGPFIGMPAIFVRLGGCNLACKFCDTQFDEFESAKIDQIIDQIQKLSITNNIKTHQLVVITGGEPLRQNIAPLCQKLIDLSYQVQIETNGTLYQDLPKQTYIVCSPKNNDQKSYYAIDQKLMPKINAFKFLISKYQKGYDFVPKNLNKLVYLQVIDEYDQKKNHQNNQLALKLSQENGYLMTLQAHKIWQID